MIRLVGFMVHEKGVRDNSRAGSCDEQINVANVLIYFSQVLMLPSYRTILVYYYHYYSKYLLYFRIFARAEILHLFGIFANVLASDSA